VAISLTKLFSHVDSPLQFEENRLFQISNLPIRGILHLPVALSPELPYITFSTPAFEVQLNSIYLESGYLDLQLSLSAWPFG